MKTLSRKEIKKRMERGVFELNIGDEKLLFFYANNRGRGDNNCTVYRVPADTPRFANTREQDADDTYLACTTTSSWRGFVNLSHRVLEDLGL